MNFHALKISAYTVSLRSVIITVYIYEQIYMWNFRDNKDIIGCAFIDSKLYIHSATSIRNFILIADVLQSVTLLQHRVSCVAVVL